jgi:hypothetical protein
MTKFRTVIYFQVPGTHTAYHYVPKDPAVPGDTDSVRYDGDGERIQRNIGPNSSSVNVDSEAPFVALFDAMIAAGCP